MSVIARDAIPPSICEWHRREMGVGQRIDFSKQGLDVLHARAVLEVESGLAALRRQTTILPLRILAWRSARCGCAPKARSLTDATDGRRNKRGRSKVDDFS